MEDIGEKLKNVEVKYKKKLEEKDLIINQLDIQLQEYEKKLNLNESNNIHLKDFEDNEDNINKYLMKNKNTNFNIQKNSSLTNEDIKENKDNSI